jgi:hypothetical protein
VSETISEFKKENVTKDLVWWRSFRWNAISSRQNSQWFQTLTHCPQLRF